MSTETPGTGELSLPQAFLLLATNDKDGEPEVPPSVLKAGLAGAILAELDLLGAVRLDGKYVRAVGEPPPSDFRHQWELIHDKSRPHSPRRWVAMLENRAELHRVYEGMAALGVVTHVGEKHLGVFRTTRYPEKDHVPKAALLARIEGVLNGSASDARTTALIGLLHAAGLMDKLFPGAGPGRLRELTGEHWPSRAVRDELRMIRLAEAEAAT
ncbi:GOLPH3/VPS74 family protein [Arthrobacter sp. QXT-31]|uniref:GOLPH3/VPS74 family protein n=1 Tax=Arthrobacter sp. QXT-31 TaxID=1357915 RepID=UPI000971A53F|nr:GPP34 family phosphoprotein [Arthrobacter sp. QXT-31]APX02564.1 GPP34 family phosphoprotein [Arthrobacter sp. QXT-31]